MSPFTLVCFREEEHADRHVTKEIQRRRFLPQDDRAVPGIGV
jgi:hypothetical protein